MQKENAKKTLNIAIIVAAGKGKRIGNSLPKQYLTLKENCNEHKKDLIHEKFLPNANTILSYTIQQFLKHQKIDKIYVIISKNDYDYYNNVIDFIKKKYLKIKTKNNLYWINSRIAKISDIPIIGGEERWESVRAGVNRIYDDYCDTSYSLDQINLLIHDAVRPFVESQIITRVIKSLNQYNVVDVAIDCSDTLKYKSNKLYHNQIINRSDLYATQTPQGFNFVILHYIMKHIVEKKNIQKQLKLKHITDEVQLYLQYLKLQSAQWQGNKHCLKNKDPYSIDSTYSKNNSSNHKFIPIFHKKNEVCIVKGSDLNFKITTLEDLQYARYVFTKKCNKEYK